MATEKKLLTSSKTPEKKQNQVVPKKSEPLKHKIETKKINTKKVIKEKNKKPKKKESIYR